MSQFRPRLLAERPPLAVIVGPANGGRGSVAILMQNVCAALMLSARERHPLLICSLAYGIDRFAVVMNTAKQHLRERRMTTFSTHRTQWLSAVAATVIILIVVNIGADGRSDDRTSDRRGPDTYTCLATHVERSRSATGGLAPPAVLPGEHRSRRLPSGDGGGEESGEPSLEPPLFSQQFQQLRTLEHSTYPCGHIVNPQRAVGGSRHVECPDQLPHACGVDSRDR